MNIIPIDPGKEFLPDIYSPGLYTSNGKLALNAPLKGSVNGIKLFKSRAYGDKRTLKLSLDFAGRIGGLFISLTKKNSRELGIYLLSYSMGADNLFEIAAVVQELKRINSADPEIDSYGLAAPEAKIKLIGKNLSDATFYNGIRGGGAPVTLREIQIYNAPDKNRLNIYFEVSYLYKTGTVNLFLPYAASKQLGMGLVALSAELSNPFEIVSLIQQLKRKDPFI